MGRAAEILGVTPAFLRGLDAAELLIPQRSPGGHRRYSRYQLRIAVRARALVDAGAPLEAACRIIVLEDQLTEALELNAQLSPQDPPTPDPTTDPHSPTQRAPSSAHIVLPPPR